MNNVLIKATMLRIPSVIITTLFISQLYSELISFDVSSL